MSETPYQGRGMATPRIEEKSLQLLGYKIENKELRLMAYAQYVLMNEQKIKMEHCNRDDRDILQKWREAGHIEGGASGLAVTKEFWDIMCELLFLGYVDLHE